MRPLLRAFVTLTTLAVVWLVASPARAQAPLSRDVRLSHATVAAMSMLTEPEDAREPDADAPPASSDASSTGAGLCDRRGATSLAPPPQMQEREATLDTTLTLEDCLSDVGVTRSATPARRAAPERAPVATDSSSSDPAVLTAVASLAAPVRERTPAPIDTVTHGPIGIRSTIDRPPREASAS
ncbi:MAG: hypothetical protein JWP97_3414 [Labilithrix sp.]|nr:hypothetical protein [Labilithrix sp.]